MKILVLKAFKIIYTSKYSFFLGYILKFFLQKSILNHAAALSFYLILSFSPTVLLIYFIVDSSHIIEILLKSLNNIFFFLTGVSIELQFQLSRHIDGLLYSLSSDEVVLSILKNQKSDIKFGIFGLIIMVSFTRFAVLSIKKAFQVIYYTTDNSIEEVSIVKLILKNISLWLLMVVFILIFLSSIGISIFLDYISSIQTINIVDKGLYIVSFLYSKFSIYLFLFIVFIISYMYIPQQKIRLKNVFLPASIATVAIYLITALLPILINHNEYNIVYGYLSNIIIFIVTIYIYSMIFYVGSILVNILNNKKQFMVGVMLANKVNFSKKKLSSYRVFPVTNKDELKKLLKSNRLLIVKNGSININSPDINKVYKTGDRLSFWVLSNYFDEIKISHNLKILHFNRIETDKVKFFFPYLFF